MCLLSGDLFIFVANKRERDGNGSISKLSCAQTIFYDYFCWEEESFIIQD